MPNTTLRVCLGNSKLAAILKARDIFNFRPLVDNVNRFDIGGMDNYNDGAKMIPDDAVNIWAHTKESLYPLYHKRAEGLAEELDCHRQAAEIYAPYHKPGDEILDAGAGSGYFYWSLKRRGLLGNYWALDCTRDFLDIGRAALSEELPQDRFLHKSLEEAPGEYDITFCLNTLFALPDYRQALDRLLSRTGRLFILRTTLSFYEYIRYETDDYLDPGAAGKMKAYFNIWKLGEVSDFITGCGFEVTPVVDQRTLDRVEFSAGKPFPWRWLTAVRKA